MPGGKKGRIVTPYKRSRGLPISDSQKSYIARKTYCAHHGLNSVPSGYVVHHQDGSINNNDITNLKLLTREEHTRIHPRALGKGKYGLIWVGNEANYAREKRWKKKKEWLEKELTEEQKKFLLSLKLT